MNQESREWRDLLAGARPSQRDRIHYFDFAEDVVPVPPGGGTELSPNRRRRTRTATAIESVLAAQNPSRPTRILLFTDGYATEPLSDVSVRLAAEGVPLDYRLIQPPASQDYRIAAIEAPARVQSGEAFLLRAKVTGSGGKSDVEVPISLMRDGETIAETVVPLRSGSGVAEWADRLGGGGSHSYEFIISPEVDAHAGNNRAATWVEITSGPRILVISRHPDDPLAAAFSSQGYRTQLLTDPSRASPGMLAGARAVVLRNVPAHDFPSGFLASLDFFVREQAGGLLMLGGRYSFGSGGYFQSPIDELLPVSMELKADQRKLALAMAIALDRSGSMMAPAIAPPGKTKMDLVNSGAAAAINLLGGQDSIAVFAVDSTAHTVVPLIQVGNNREKLVKQVSSIRSGGGGIYVYEALEAAWAELRKATAGTRHIVLFADANDAENPAGYKRLLKEITNAGGTVSVVGLGTKRDVDSALLAEIARVFAGETVSVARSTFIDESTNLAATGEWNEISSLPMMWPPVIDGYNLSYARPGATVSALSGDEYTAPLVATIRRGLGRTAAISFPMAGEGTEKILQWEGYNGFARTLGRWLVGETVPAGIGFVHRIEGNRLTLDLRYDVVRWSTEMAATPPRLLITLGHKTPEPKEIRWSRVAPGHFSASFDLEESDQLRGVVQIGKHTLPFGPLSVPISAEWSFDPARLTDLQYTSKHTGGVQRNDLSTAWERPPVVQRSDLRLPLILLVLGLMLLDAFVTKTGFRFALPSLAKRGRDSRQKSRTKRRRRTTPVVAEPEPVEEPEAVATAEEDAEARRRSRFQQVKKSRTR